LRPSDELGLGGTAEVAAVTDEKVDRYSVGRTIGQPFPRTCSEPVEFLALGLDPRNRLAALPGVLPLAVVERRVPLERP
jgi:hypothetical protein